MRHQVFIPEFKIFILQQIVMSHPDVCNDDTRGDIFYRPLAWVTMKRAIITFYVNLKIKALYY